MMTNTLGGSMGNLKAEVFGLKSEKPCKVPSSDDDVSVEFKKITPVPSSFDLENICSLTPTSLNFPPLKFEVMDGGDVVEVQSPDNSLWEYFSDNLEGDFMISSPLRNIPSLTSNYSNTFNHVHGQNSLMACSPPRMSPLGPYGSSSTTHSAYNNKGKERMSPLNRMFCNSPSNQFMQVESLSLPALENFLDDYEREEEIDDDFLSSYSSSMLKSVTPGTIGSSTSDSNHYDTITTVPALLDCLTLPNSSRFSASVSKTSSIEGGRGSSQLTQEESDRLYNRQIGPTSTVPLLQQLQQERQQEKQQHQLQQQRQLPPLRPPPRAQQQQQQQQQQPPQNLDRCLMVSIPPDQEQDSGLQLLHLLLVCAEAVSKEDYMLARRYLHHLSRVVSPLGDSMQRVASCFTDALTERLTATLTPKPTTSTPSKPFNPFPPDSLEILKIYQILYQACPYIKFAHFTANQAIFEAFEAEERVHVIDLDILQGYQWPAFMQALAARPAGPPFLRITGVGTSPEAVRETGRCLTELANSLHVPFEFHPVGEQLEDLKPHMFNRRVGEALAVNSVNRLQRVPGNSLSNLLAMIRDQAPNIVTIVEQEASHNGPYFLGRFLEALHYYSAIFDSLDATFPPESTQRSKVEQYIFAPEIKNIVACEGLERTMRHERLEKWRKIMEGKGFKGVPLSLNAVTQSEILLRLYSCDGYSLTEDKGSLLLGWQDRAILAASAWRC